MVQVTSKSKGKKGNASCIYVDAKETKNNIDLKKLRMPMP